MRSNASFVVFLLALLISDVFSASILKKSSNVRMSQMLEKVELNTHFGKTLMNAVQLKLKSGSVDDIYALLDELIANIQEQQADADEEHQLNNAEWNSQIAAFEQTIADLNADLNARNTDLADLQAQQLTHEAIYNDLVAVGVDLSNQMDALNDWWATFNEAYSARQAERQRVLDALDTIIAMLTDRYNAGSFIQLKDLVSTLKSAKSQKNPILALVQLTLSFNPATVKSVIDKLTSVRESVSLGAAQDSTYFDYEKAYYTFEESSLQTLIQENTDAQNTEVVLLADLRNDIADTQARIDSDNAQIANTQDLLQATHDAQDTYNSKYTEDTSIRTDEVAVIQHVQEILNSNDSNLRANE